MRTLQETMKDVDAKKRTLEESVDALNEECAKLKAAGNNLDWIEPNILSKFSILLILNLKMSV